jgi:molecular chaperone HtpG
MDYPFNLKGILYFPKINMEYDTLEGKIKLYSNQVFIADNIKEVIPEFLLLLKGVIDCPDMPLNVSRSALQNDGFVKKISEYISKKVADKLSGMFKTGREEYEKYWDDISPFIKFGCLKDDKFREKMKDFMLYKNLEKKFITLEEYLEKLPKLEEDTAEKGETATTDDVGDSSGSAVDGVDSTGGAASEGSDSPSESSDPDAPQRVEAEIVDEDGEPKPDAEDDDDDADAGDEKAKKQTVYYITDEVQQSQYIKMFTEQGIDAVYLTHNIDQPFISQIERDNDKVRFSRIDGELTDDFTEDAEKKEKKKLKKKGDSLQKLFRKVLGDDKLELKLEKFKSKNVSAVITLSEEARRMQDMMKMYSMGGEMPDMFGGPVNITLNANHPLVEYISEHEKGDDTPLFVEQVYDLARLAHSPLSPEAMTKFVERSNEVLVRLAR